VAKNPTGLSPLPYRQTATNFFFPEHLAIPLGRDLG
jgi:hypothetical protein